MNMAFKTKVEIECKSAQSTDSQLVWNTNSSAVCDTDAIAHTSEAMANICFPAERQK